MNLKSVSNELNIMLNKRPGEGQKRNIVFWYDDGAEFSNKLTELKLENAKILIYEKDSSFFRIKCILEHDDTASNYLVYAPFAEPKAEDNYLADIGYYSQKFSADITSVYMRDLGITDSQMFLVIKSYGKFLTAKERIDKLKSYGINEWTPKVWHLAVLSAVIKLQKPNFDKAIEALLMDYTEETNLIERVREYCDIAALNEIVKNRFGIDSAFNNIERFACRLLVTHLSGDAAIPGAWSKFLPDNKNEMLKTNIQVFVDYLMNAGKGELYLELSSKISDKLNVSKYLETIASEDAETFRCFDFFFLGYASHLTDVGDYDACITLVNKRKKKHFYKDLENEYNALFYAAKFLKVAAELRDEFVESEPEALLRAYTASYYNIDKYYRRFIYFYDKAQNDKFDDESWEEHLSDLFEKIENLYTNKFLNALAVKWSDLIKDRSIKNVSLFQRQHRFFNKVEHVKDKIVVIISDALRYEAGVSLKEKLAATLSSEVSIEPCLSVLPSITSLGMAALLPHNEIEINNHGDVLVDGINSATLENRQKILDSFCGNAVVLSGEKVKELKSKIKDVISGKEIIYIYHNLIDAIGDKTASEDKVFDAVEDTFDEILTMVRHLFNASVSKVLITADHGFIYKRTRLSELDRTPVEIKDCVDSGRRYQLLNSKINADFVRVIRLDGIKNEMYAAIPYGTNIFKKPGKSAKFVHGGDSLQEIIVPIITCVNKTRTNTKDKNTAKGADISLISLQRKITSLITFLEFIQKDKISEKILPATYKIYFTDSNDREISSSAIIHADSKAEDSKSRIFKEKLTFKNMKYDKNAYYYLVIEKIDDYDNTKFKEAFQIDMLLESDFD